MGEPTVDANRADFHELPVPVLTVHQPEVDADGADARSGGTSPTGTPPVRRSRSGPDPEFLAELYRSERLRLTRLAILLVDDLASAEDVVEDAFVELHRRWDTRRARDPVSYLRTTVIGNARSVLRRRRRGALPINGVVGHPADGSTAADAVMAEDHREILAVIKILPPRQREVLILRYWSNLTETEIADTLGIAPAAVSVATNRALKAVEQALR